MAVVRDKFMKFLLKHAAKQTALKLIWTEFLSRRDESRESHCTSHLDRSTWKLSCDCKPYWRSDLLSHQALVVHTFSALPYRNLVKGKYLARIRIRLCKLTVFSKRACLTLNNFATPATRARNGGYAWLRIDVRCIEPKLIFTASQLTSRSALITSFYKS